MFDYDPNTGILSNRRLQKPAGFVAQGGNSTKPHRVVKLGDNFFMVPPYYESKSISLLDCEGGTAVTDTQS